MSVRADKWDLQIRVETDEEMTSEEAVRRIEKGLPGRVSVESIVPVMDEEAKIVHQDLSDSAHLRLPEDMPDD